MKCHHCGKEHADNPKFCPETGKKIELQVLYCADPDCDYRQPLPINAKFCPNCGTSLIEMNSKKEEFPYFMLKDCHDRIRIINFNGEPLFEKSFQLIEEYFYDDKITIVKDCIITDGSKAFLAMPNGKLLEIDDYNDEDIVGKSIDGQFILTIHNRSAKLFRKDVSGLVLLSQFRFKYNEIETFDVIGDYVSFYNSEVFASINYKNGDILKVPGYKYSMLLSFSGNEHICLACKNSDFNSDNFCVVDLQGHVIRSFSSGVYWLCNDSKYLLKIHNNKVGLVSINGKEIIPPYFDGIEFSDGNHVILHLGEWTDCKRRKIIYNLTNTSFVTNHWGEDHKVKCTVEPLPESIDELDEILESYEFGFGFSSDYLINENNEIVRRSDRQVLYQMDENEYPIGASDKFQRFGIYDQKYLSIYDNDGNLLKELYQSKGIANPRLYDNGIILFFDIELKELCVVDIDFNMTTIHSDDHFGGASDAISSNCIVAEDIVEGIFTWVLYNATGNLILPKNTIIFGWKKLNNQFVVLETGNYKTNQDHGLAEKNGILINLSDNSIQQISIPYQEVFLLG